MDDKKFDVVYINEKDEKDLKIDDFDLLHWALTFMRIEARLNKINENSNGIRTSENPDID